MFLQPLASMPTTARADPPHSLNPFPLLVTLLHSVLNPIPLALRLIPFVASLTNHDQTDQSQTRVRGASALSSSKEPALSSSKGAWSNSQPAPALRSW